MTNQELRTSTTIKFLEILTRCYPFAFRVCPHCFLYQHKMHMLSPQIFLISPGYY